jgi:hypothetical protein
MLTRGVQSKVAQQLGSRAFVATRSSPSRASRAQDMDPELEELLSQPALDEHALSKYVRNMSPDQMMNLTRNPQFQNFVRLNPQAQRMMATPAKASKNDVKKEEVKKKDVKKEEVKKEEVKKEEVKKKDVKKEDVKKEEVKKKDVKKEDVKKEEVKKVINEEVEDEEKLEDSRGGRARDSEEEQEEEGGAENEKEASKLANWEDKESSSSRSADPLPDPKRRSQARFSTLDNDAEDASLTPNQVRRRDLESAMQRYRIGTVQLPKLLADRIAEVLQGVHTSLLLMSQRNLVGEF